MAREWYGWTLASGQGFSFEGCDVDYRPYDAYGLIMAGRNILEITSKSRNPYVGVRIVLEDSLPPVDTDERWELIAETSVSFDVPPALGDRRGRVVTPGADDRIYSAVLRSIDIPAGTYRVRCSVTGATAARQISDWEFSSDDAGELPEQFEIRFAPTDHLEPPAVIRSHPKKHEWYGWVLCDENGFNFAGSDVAYNGGTEFNLVTADQNILMITATSDIRHAGVRVFLHESLPPVDTDEHWESIAETTVSFDAPPAIGRDRRRWVDEREASAALRFMDILPGMYRVRGSVSGSIAAYERAFKGSQSEPTPTDAGALLEQFEIHFAPADHLEPPTVIRETHFVWRDGQIQAVVTPAPEVTSEE